MALTLWGLLSLLPPGAWALCSGPHGHVALEPVATSCRDTDPARAGAECCTPAGEDCVDLPLLDGLALQQAKPELESPACVSSVPSWLHALFEPVIEPGEQTAALLVASPPAARSSILRC